MTLEKFPSGSAEQSSVGYIFFALRTVGSIHIGTVLKLWKCFTFCVFKTLPPWKKEYRDDTMRSWQSLWQIWPKFSITAVTTIQVTPLFISVQKSSSRSLYRSWKDSKLAGEQIRSLFWINSAPQTHYWSKESANAVYCTVEPSNQESLKKKIKALALWYIAKDKRTDSVMTDCRVCDLLKIKVIF